MSRIEDGFKRTTVSLRNEEYEALRFMAFKKKKSIAAMVRELIQERLEEEEDRRDGLRALEEEGDTMEWETFKREYLGIRD